MYLMLCLVSPGVPTVISLPGIHLKCSECVYWLGDLEVVAHSPQCCELLANSLTVFECIREDDGLNVQNMTTLTRLTELQLSPGGGDLLLAPNIHQLQHLAHLKTLQLHLFDSFPVSLATLTTVQHLELHCHLDVGGSGEPCNLSQATQLTCLDISWDDSADDINRVVLPCGQGVSLLNLTLAFQDQGGGLADFLSNLGAASQLQKVFLDSISAPDLEHVPWPQAMPGLTSLRALYMTCSLPFEWSQYSALQELDLEGMMHATLPDWFSELKQLKSLTLAQSSLTEFPLCLMHLSQLETLDMSCIFTSLTLPMCIRSFCSWKSHTDILGFQKASHIWQGQL